MSAFSSPFTHWPQKFPRPIIVAPVVRGSGGWAVPFTPSTRTPPASPRRTGPHAPILSVEGSADPAGSHRQAIGEAGTISQAVVLIGAALIVLFVISFAASMRAPG